MQVETQNDINFTLVEGRENIYNLQTKDDLLKWLKHLDNIDFDYNSLDPHTSGTFMTKNDNGDFVHYVDKKSKKTLVSNITFTGIYRNLIPSGYTYSNKYNITYYKELEGMEMIWIRKAGNSLTFSNLSHLSGFLLQWFIDRKFDSIKCIRNILICSETGKVRLKEDGFWKSPLQNEHSIYITKGFFLEVKHMYDNNLLKLEPISEATYLL
jgi:hypothetical protein